MKFTRLLQYTLAFVFIGLGSVLSYGQTAVKLKNVTFDMPYGWSSKKMSRNDSTLCIRKTENGFACACVSLYNGKGKDALKNFIKKDLETRKEAGQDALEKGKETMNNLKVQVNKWQIKEKSSDYVEKQYIFQYKTLLYVISFKEKTDKFEASSKKVLEAIDKFKIAAN